MTTVVKVQKPLAGTGTKGIWLVYAKDRKHIVEQHLDYATQKVMGDDLKAFFEADYRPTQNVWTIGKRVKDRDW